MLSHEKALMLRIIDEIWKISDGHYIMGDLISETYSVIFAKLIQHLLDVEDEKETKERYIQAYRHLVVDIHFGSNPAFPNKDCFDTCPAGHYHEWDDDNCEDAYEDCMLPLALLSIKVINIALNEMDWVLDGLDEDTVGNMMESENITEEECFRILKLRKLRQYLDKYDSAYWEKPMDTIFPDEKTWERRMRDICTTRRCRREEALSLTMLTVAAFQEIVDFDEHDFPEMFDVPDHHTTTEQREWAVTYIKTMLDCGLYPDSRKQTLLERRAVKYCDWVRERNLLRSIVRILKNKGTAVEKVQRTITVEMEEPVFRISRLREHIWKPRSNGEMPPAAQICYERCMTFLERLS